MKRVPRARLRVMIARLDDYAIRFNKRSTVNHVWKPPVRRQACEERVSFV